MDDEARKHIPFWEKRRGGGPITEWLEVRGLEAKKKLQPKTEPKTDEWLGGFDGNGNAWRSKSRKGIQHSTQGRMRIRPSEWNGEKWWL